MTDEDRTALEQRIARIDARAAAGQPWADDATARVHYQDELEADARRRARQPRRDKWQGSWLTRVALAGPAPRTLVAACLTTLGRGIVLRSPMLCKTALVRLVALADMQVGDTCWRLTPEGAAALEVAP